MDIKIISFENIRFFFILNLNLKLIQETKNFSVHVCIRKGKMKMYAHKINRIHCYK